MAHERLPRSARQPIPEPVAELIRATSRAKRAAARMYQAWHAQAPDADARKGIAELAQDEHAHAVALDRLLGLLTVTPNNGAERPFPADSEDRGLAIGWPSALMASFALDQAATACLTALALAPLPDLTRLARSILADERDHQRFVIDMLRGLADANPPLGQRLAVEMIVARDWVREVFPRHNELAALVERGLLPRDAPRTHDTALASLGDRIQEALGVLGC